MTHRTVLLLAGAAILGSSPTALAQDGRYESLQPPVGGAVHQSAYERETGQYDGQWEGEWADEETWHGEWTGIYTDAEGRSVEADYRGVWMGESRFISEDGPMLSYDGHGWRERRGHRRHSPARFAYSPRERAQWLSDCRYVMAGSSGYYDSRYDDDGNGELIGGLLGAVIGGVAGNRIADGDRLLGTVVGAGLGGVAGAAIGSAVDDNGHDEIDRDELWAARYCEAYLARYEMSASYWGQGQAVRMVPVRRRHRHTVDCNH